MLSIVSCAAGLHVQVNSQRCPVGEETVVTFETKFSSV